MIFFGHMGDIWLHVLHIYIHTRKHTSILCELRKDPEDPKIHWRKMRSILLMMAIVHFHDRIILHLGWCVFSCFHHMARTHSHTFGETIPFSFKRYTPTWNPTKINISTPPPPKKKHKMFCFPFRIFTFTQLDGGFQIFFVFPLPGEMIQVDEHMPRWMPWCTALPVTFTASFMQVQRSTSRVFIVVIFGQESHGFFWKKPMFSKSSLNEMFFLLRMLLWMISVVFFFWGGETLIFFPFFGEEMGGLFSFLSLQHAFSSTWCTEVLLFLWCTVFDASELVEILTCIQNPDSMNGVSNLPHQLVSLIPSQRLGCLQVWVCRSIRRVILKVCFPGRDT